MFCYARIFDMVVLDLVFIRNGLVCIFMFFLCVLAEIILALCSLT